MVTLGLLPPYTREDVQAAYREKAKTTHPDSGGSAIDFKKLHEAYEQAQEYLKFHLNREVHVPELLRVRPDHFSTRIHSQFHRGWEQPGRHGRPAAPHLRRRAAPKSLRPALSRDPGHLAHQFARG
jgi:hypothetical protein